MRPSHRPQAQTGRWHLEYSCHRLIGERPGAEPSSNRPPKTWSMAAAARATQHR
jgi:hypothetical protein